VPWQLGVCEGVYNYRVRSVPGGEMRRVGVGGGWAPSGGGVQVPKGLGLAEARTPPIPILDSLPPGTPRPLSTPNPYSLIAARVPPTNMPPDTPQRLSTPTLYTLVLRMPHTMLNERAGF